MFGSSATLVCRAEQGVEEEFGLHPISFKDDELIRNCFGMGKVLDNDNLSECCGSYTETGYGMSFSREQRFRMQPILRQFKQKSCLGLVIYNFMTAPRALPLFTLLWSSIVKQATKVSLVNLTFFELFF